MFKPNPSKTGIYITTAIMIILNIVLVVFILREHRVIELDWNTIFITSTPLTTTIPDRDIEEVKLNVDIQDRGISTIEETVKPETKTETKSKGLKWNYWLGISIVGVAVVGLAVWVMWRYLGKRGAVNEVPVTPVGAGDMASEVKDAEDVKDDQERPYGGVPLEPMLAEKEKLKQTAKEREAGALVLSPTPFAFTAKTMPLTTRYKN